MTFCELTSRLGARASVVLLAWLIGVAPLPAWARPDHALPASGSARGLEAAQLPGADWPEATVVIGGASMLRLTAADEAHLAKRLAEVRARLRAAVTRDETFRPSGSLKVLRSGHEPLIGLGRMPIVTVTIVDASRVQRPASDLAERWIESLGVAMSRLPVGDAWDEAWFRVERPSGKPWEPRLLAAAILEVGELVPFGGTGIRASLHGHLLRLTGEVASLGEKLALGRNARNLPGVRDIDNRLQVRGDAPGKDLPPEANWLPAATLSPAGLATGGHR